MRIVLAMAAGAMLALATPVSAQTPASPPALVAMGYSEEQIGPDRFRVRIGGEQLDWGGPVERYLLYRAAQLTIARGFDTLTLISRDPGAPALPYIAQCSDCEIWQQWRPYWRWYSTVGGWQTYDPFQDFPDFVRRVAPETVERYEASADFVLGRNPRTFNSREFDARMVIEELGPTIAVPK